MSSKSNVCFKPGAICLRECIAFSRTRSDTSSKCIEFPRPGVRFSRQEQSVFKLHGISRTVSDMSSTCVLFVKPGAIYLQNVLYLSSQDRYVFEMYGISQAKGGVTKFVLGVPSFSVTV